MECKFEIGQMVVCVSRKCSSCGYDAPGLIEKNIYTINGIGEIYQHGVSPVQAEIVVTVAEATACSETMGCYHHTCFRPVKKTSLDCFNEALKGKPVKERV